MGGGRRRRQRRDTCAGPHFRAVRHADRHPVLVSRRVAPRGDDDEAAGAAVRPWLVVAGDFTPLGAMDIANHALARHLAARGDVHVVAHRVWTDLAALPTLTVNPVWRP